MKAKVSELMDGELEGTQAERLVTALREDGEGRNAWRTYHLIGDALRDTRALSRGFSDRMWARLAEEPTVLAPAERPEAAKGRLRGFLVPVAASAAAVAMVGWLAFAPPGDGPSHALAPVATAPAVQATPAAVGAEPSVPLPKATDDYLLAHQNYASRSPLQGVAPYVRTVSGRSAEYRR